MEFWTTGISPAAKVGQSENCGHVFSLSLRVSGVVPALSVVERYVLEWLDESCMTLRRESILRFVG